MGECHVICIKYGEMGAELLLSKKELQGQEKIQNTGPYTGYFMGEIQENAM